MAEGYYIPKTLENWKWPRRINPHYHEVQPEATVWIKSFKALRPQTQEALDRGDFSTSSYIYLGHVHILTRLAPLLDLFASLCYPLHDMGKYLSQRDGALSLLWVNSPPSHLLRLHEYRRRLRRVCRCVLTRG